MNHLSMGVTCSTLKKLIDQVQNTNGISGKADVPHLLQCHLLEEVHAADQFNHLVIARALCLQIVITGLIMLI